MIVHKQQKTLLSCLILKWSTGIKIQIDAHKYHQWKRNSMFYEQKKMHAFHVSTNSRYEGQNAESF